MPDPTPDPTTDLTPPSAIYGDDDAADNAPTLEQTEPPSPSTNASLAPGFDPSPNTRRCFVCLVDEPEDDLPKDWSTPCTCSLEGHQECLLAWVTDLEAQAKDVACPQCKSPITVTERYDPAIHLSNFLHNKFSRWSPRILLGFIASGALLSSSVYGAKAISWFAGPDAIVAFLMTDNKAASRLDLIRRPRYDQSINLVHFSILPLIAPALVLNRMNVGDLIALPASLAYATVFNHSAEFFTWPPSPDRVMAVYPALKTTYFRIHRHLSDSLEKSWAAQARALGGEHAPQPTHDFDPAPEPAPAMNILDLEIDIQIGEPDDLPQNDGDPPRNRFDANRGSPINFIAGALLWPGVCYGVGELMRHILPSRLVTKPASGPVTGLLQERWGRSFVGGCLFVVLKDAFFLYVKYKKMMNRPYRRIKNSDRRNIRN